MTITTICSPSTTTGGNLIIQVGNGSAFNRLFYSVYTKSHEMNDNNTYGLANCNNCGHQFFKNKTMLFTLEKDIQDSTCNEVVMKDIME